MRGAEDYGLSVFDGRGRAPPFSYPCSAELFHIGGTDGDGPLCDYHRFGAVRPHVSKTTERNSILRLGISFTWSDEAEYKSCTPTLQKSQVSSLQRCNRQAGRRPRRSAACPTAAHGTRSLFVLGPLPPCPTPPPRGRCFPECPPGTAVPLRNHPPPPRRWWAWAKTSTPPRSKASLLLLGWAAPRLRQQLGASNGGIHYGKARLPARAGGRARGRAPPSRATITI